MLDEANSGHQIQEKQLSEMHKRVKGPVLQIILENHNIVQIC